METLHYKILINAPIQKVWDLLWNEKTYNAWTQFFSKDSQFKTDWEIGGKTYFTDKKGDGMVATIKTLNPPYEIIFSHLGMIKDGIEDTKSKEVEEWSGSEEKYFLREIDQNTTELQASLRADERYEEMMNTGFNKGFEVLKSLAEN